MFESRFLFSFLSIIFNLQFLFLLLLLCLSLCTERFWGGGKGALSDQLSWRLLNRHSAQCHNWGHRSAVSPGGVRQARRCFARHRSYDHFEPWQGECETSAFVSAIWGSAICWPKAPMKLCKYLLINVLKNYSCGNPFGYSNTTSSLAEEEDKEKKLTRAISHQPSHERNIRRLLASDGQNIEWSKQLVLLNVKLLC